MSDKVNLIWYNKIGLPLKKFIQEKYGSQMKCCRYLHIRPSRLSMIIVGKRKMSYYDQEKFVSAGFDKAIFYNYISVLPEDDYESIDDLKFVIGELKEIIYSKQRIIDSLEMLNSNLGSDLQDFKKQVTELKKKIHNLVYAQKYTGT